MWGATAGITSATQHDHAAYLSHWLGILRSDARALVTVASKAKQVVDHLVLAAGGADAETEHPAVG